MIATHKVKPAISAYWFAIIFIIIVFGRYGSEAIEWLLMKLYEFFVQLIPMVL